MSKTRLDESRWPLVIFTAVGSQTEDDFEAYLEDCDHLLARRELHGGIFDARRGEPIGPKLRKRQVQWLEQNEGLLRAYLVGTGMVMNSAVQRGVFRAILWMRPMPIPYCIESSFEAARRFVCGELVAQGCDMPPMFSWDVASRDLASPRRSLYDR